MADEFVESLKAIRLADRAEEAKSRALTGLDGDSKKAAHAMEMSDGDQDAAQYAYGNYDLASKAYKARLTQAVIDGDPNLQVYLNNNPMAKVVSNNDFANLANYNDKMVPLAQAFSDPVAWLAAPAFLHDVEENPSGYVNAGARAIGHGIIPAYAGVMGIEPGVAAGTAIGTGLSILAPPAAPVLIPTGAFLGGVAGAILTSYLAATAQEKAIEKFLPEEAERYRKAAEEYPITSLIGTLLPNAALFGVGGLTREALIKSIPTRAAGAGVMATITAVEEEIVKGELDPTELTAVAVGGAIFAGKPTMFGEQALGLGRAIGTGRFITRFFRQGETPPQGNPVWDQARVEETKEVMGRFDEATDAAKKSETRNELSPDLFAKLTEQHTKADIGIKREAVDKLLEGKPPEPGDGVLGDVPGIQRQLELFPRLTGEDIKIPFSSVIKLADEIIKELHDDIRPRGDLYTLNEAKDVPEPQGEWDNVPPPLPPGQEDQQLIDDVRRGAGVDPLIKETPVPGPEPETVLFKSGTVLPKRDYDKIVKDIKAIQEENRDRQLAREEKKAARRRSAEWNKESAEMFDEVADVIDNKPDVRGWKFLTDGEFRGEDTGLIPKINPESLSPEARKNFPEHWLSSGGLDADLVARELGFNTADDFADSMIAFRNAKGTDTFTQLRSKAIQAEIKRRMEAKYGVFEKLNADEARQLVPTPTIQDMLWHEFEILGDMLGLKLPFSRDDIKAMAGANFGLRNHEKVSLISVTRDLGRAGYKAHKAWAKGDILGAFQARQESVGLLEMARIAAKFEQRKKADDRILEQLKEVEPTNMDPEYADMAHQLMLWHQIPTKRTEAHLAETLSRPERQYKNIKDWVNSKNIPIDPNDPISVGLPQGYNDFPTKYNPNFPIWDDLITPGSDVFKKPFDELSVTEYKGVTNALRVFKKMGQDQSKGIIDIPGMGEVKAKDFAIELGQSIERFNEIARPKSQWLLSGLKGFRWTQTKLMTIDNLFGRLASQDENGPWARLLYSINEQENQFVRWSTELAHRFGKELGEESRAWWNKKVDNTGIINPVFKRPLDMNNGSVVLLNLVTMTQDAIKHTAKGYRMKPEALIAERDKLSTKEHYNMAMKIADQFDWAQGHADDMTMKRSGTILEKQELGMVPWKGKDVPGRYYPRKRDEAISPAIMTVGDEHPHNVSVSLPHGFMEELTGADYAVQLEKFDAGELAGDLTRRLKFAAMQPVADVFNKVLRRPEVIEPLMRHFGSEHKDMIQQFFNDIAGVQGNRKGLDGVVNRVFNAESSAALTTAIGFNLSTIEKHSFQSIAQSIGELHWRFFKEAAVDLLRNNALSEGINRDFIRNGGIVGGQKVEGVGELLKRSRTYKDDPRFMARQMMGETLWANKYVKDFARAGMFVIRTVDRYMSEITAMARYRQRMRENVDRLTDGKNLSPEEYNNALVEAHNLSIAQSDRMVRNTHGSSSIVSQPEWLRSQNAMVRSGAMAYNFFNNALNRRMRSWYMIQDIVKGRSPRPLMQDVGRIGTDIFIYGVLPTLIENMVEPICKTNDDAMTCTSKWMAQGAVAPIPILRDAVHAYITDTPMTYGIYANMINYARRLKNSSKAYFAHDDESKLGDMVENAMALTGGLIGAPLSKPGAWTKYWINYNEGRENWIDDWDKLQRVLKKGRTKPTKFEREHE